VAEVLVAVGAQAEEVPGKAFLGCPAHFSE